MRAAELMDWWKRQTAGLGRPAAGGQRGAARPAARAGQAPAWTREQAAAILREQESVLAEARRDPRYDPLVVLMIEAGCNQWRAAAGGDHRELFRFFEAR